MKTILAFLLALVLSAAPATAQQAPAGYVVSVALAAGDKTAIVRSGRELAPKLMMPLYDGDVVFLRDQASRVTVEVGDGDRVEIGGGHSRYEIKGEIATGDDAWAIISAITEILGGEDTEQVPENMVAKGVGGALKLPMAVPGPNFLMRGERKLWLAWTGGKAPFKVIVEVDGRARVFDAIREREFTVDVPAGDHKRFEIIIKDTANGLSRTTFRFRDRIPDPPETLTGAAPGETTSALAHAAFLTTIHEGDWTVEAAQLLHRRAREDEAAAALLDKIVRGWKLE